MRSSGIRSSLLSAAVVVLIPLAISGQEKPNFTGTWTQIVPPLSGSSRIIRVEQHGNQLRVKLEEEGHLSIRYLKRDERQYTIGGPGEKKRTANGQVRTVSVTWEGSTLVFRRTTADGVKTSTTRETWSLSGDGTRLEQTWEQGDEEQRVVLEKR